MKFNRSFWIATALLVVWLVLGWFLGTWMGIKSPAIWYLRSGWWFLGIAGYVGYLLLRPKEAGAPPEGASANAAREIDYNFTEASKRIQAATGNKQLNSLPAIFLLGDTSAAKTTIMTQSGTEPELLAGQAMQDSSVVPTRSVNLWYARNTLFIDPAGGVVADPGARRKLFKKFLPVQLNSLLASKTPPTRSVLLTIDCDSFMQPGGANILAARARDFQTILGELSRELGSSFPVYVLFTKADKIPYFRDFVENLNEAEVADVLGVSLPLPPDGLQGSYAEKQSIRLSNAFQTIYYSLADKRPVYLAREHNPTNLSNVYEFPREFAKLKPILVQFLTDLCRPSQLGTSPFLRGFYFSGVRPITINDVAPASQLPTVEDAAFDSGATRMFNRQGKSAPIAEARQAGSRRMPQWVFLRNLFPAVLLADRVGVTAAKVNVKVNFARRLLLATAAAAALAMAAWWTISYRNNSALVHNAVDAAHAVPNLPLASGQIASTDSLQRLSRVRETLALLNKYERDGAPLSYRALLYKGSEIRQPLRTTYYALFRKLLLQPTQQTLTEISKNPGEAKDYTHYQYVYDALKAYLITTNNHDKRWENFVPVLVQHWKKEQPVDAERESQASGNFAFYAEELPEVNPYAQFSSPDKEALETARTFLNGFPVEDSIYTQMKNAAGAKLKPIVFNTDYPGTADSVRNIYRVDPWFTKDGYINFQKQVKDPNFNFNGEEWVLGPRQQHDVDLNKIRENLRVRFDNDFVKTWREFMTATSEVLAYDGNYNRAATVLARLGNATSPLMKLFCVASENTRVPTKEVADAFKPVQKVSAPGCKTQPIAGDTKPYAEGLLGLSNSLLALGPVSHPNQAGIPQAQGAVSIALGAVTSIVTGFESDPTDPSATVLNKSQRLLRDPIDGVPPTFAEIGTAAINGPAGAMCQDINPLFRKYPFNSSSKDDATLADVNKVLNPQTGLLWEFVKNALSQQVQQAGADYMAKPGVTPAITPGFLGFLNRASHISQAIYHGDASATPNMNFTIQALPSQDVDHVSLSIDGVNLATDPKDGQRQTFPWPGSTQEFSLKARLGGSSSDFSIVTATGLWAAWHAVDRADHGANSLQWTPVVPGEGPMRIHDHPVTVKLSLDPQSAQILRSGALSVPGCSGRAVQ